MAKSNEYTAKGIPVGDMLFKVLMKKAVINTQATYPHLGENLNNLKSYTTTVNSNIDTYNQHVKVNAKGINSRGDMIDDLTKILFKAYHIALDI